MNAIFRILFLGARVALASVIALAIQLFLLVQKSDYLLWVQEGAKNLAASVFVNMDIQPQYHVGYNLIGGDNIVVHTVFVVIAYIAILVIAALFSQLPFKRRIFQ